MALIQEYTHGSSYLRINSDGWSGNIINRIADSDEDRKFQFDVDFELANGRYGTAWIRTDDNSYGLVSRNAQYPHSVVGVSLEHMGDGWWDGRYSLQFLGTHTDGTKGWNYLYPCFGAAWSANETEPSELNLTSEIMNLQLYPFFSAYQQYAGVQSSIFRSINCDPNVNPVNQYIGWIVGEFHAEITTDLPLFATDDDLLDWCKDPTNPETLSKMLNYSEPITPEEQYELDKLYYYVHNIFRNVHHGQTTTYWRNYRWKPGYNSKIRFYRRQNSQNSPYDLVLVVPGGLTRYKAPKGQYNDDDEFVQDQDTLQTHFLSRSYTFYDDDQRSDVWEVVGGDFKTNIPIFANHDQATDYANDLIGIEDALNYQEIRDYLQQLPTPTFGDEDLSTELGTNGQTYFAGSCIYVLTRNQMTAFFTEIFKLQEPTIFNALKDGNLIFGDNTANAILGCLYFPFDVSEVCSLESGAGTIWIGGWHTTNEGAVGKKVNMNNKLLTIGEFQLTDMFKDVRDYEPYTQIFVQLPYCGTHQLSIQKYLNKLVTIKYAVDIFTGACTALIFSNGILLDSFDGQIGSQRPITGRTAADTFSAVLGSAGGVAGSVFAGAKSAGIANKVIGTGAAIEGAAAGEAGIGAGVGLQTGGMALGVGTAIGLGVVGSYVGTYGAFQAYSATADPPMETRGKYAGNLGLFSNQKVHFIVAIRHSERPENEAELIGLPSGRSGLIGQFSGYLKSSMVYLADGFIGSRQERDEILQMIGKGIYI